LKLFFVLTITILFYGYASKHDEKVIITGERVSRDDIKIASTTTVGELLNTMPENTVVTIPVEQDKYALRPVCFQLYKIATSALRAKEDGLTKQDLLRPLPSSSEFIVMPFSKEKHLGLSMLKIAEEIFSYDGLEASSYSAYTAESCHRQLKGLDSPIDFSVVYPQLLLCNDLEKHKDRIDCGMAVSGSKIEE
jgi:hypothetical protein